MSATSAEKHSAYEKLSLKEKIGYGWGCRFLYDLERASTLSDMVLYRCLWS